MQVATSALDGGVVDWSLAASVDEVRIGLPAQYANSVLGASLAAEEIGLLGPGILRFDCAAHGLVSSAQVVFGWLAHAVVRLLASDSVPRDTEGLVTFLFEQQPWLH